MKISCGIDFGTSNSAIAAVCSGQEPRLVKSPEGKVTMPTAVFYPAAKELTPCFGTSAVQAYVNAERGRFMRSMKRVLGTPLMGSLTEVNGRNLQFEEILAAFIGHLKNLAEREFGTEIAQVVMGRPVHFRDGDPAGDRQAEKELRQVAEAVGFKEIEFQFEPIAAAYAHEIKLRQEKLACVIDIGGGTSDFTVIRLSPGRQQESDRRNDILGSSGIRIGGNDFDKDLALQSFMPELGYGSFYASRSSSSQQLTVPAGIYHDLAEWSKINSLYTYKTLKLVRGLKLQAEEPDKIARLEEVLEQECGHSLLGAVEAGKIAAGQQEEVCKRLEFIGDKPAIRILRREFEKAIEKNVGKISAAMGESLKQAGIKAGDVELVILTGGSTEIPAVQKSLCAFFPGAEVSQDDKLSSVGLGLAYDSMRRFG